MIPAGQFLRLLYAIACPSVVCLSSVTFVRPTQAIEIFGNVSTPFGTLPICDLSIKILRRLSQGNHSIWGVGLNRRGIAKYNDFGPFRRSYLPPLVACSTAHWVQTGFVDLQGSIQPSTALPRASRSCRRPAWPTSTPLCQDRSPAGTIGQTVNCRRPSFSGRCTSYIERSTKQCYICSVITLFPAPSQDLSFSTILSGHHYGTWVDLAIALAI